jgi:hypothetical protein
LGNMVFPLRLDDITSLVGVKYDNEIGAIIYDHLLELDLAALTPEQIDEFQSLVEAHNPNGVCEGSLSLLKQGFEMVYQYRDLANRDGFRVVRTYAGCRALGYR